MPSRTATILVATAEADTRRRVVRLLQEAGYNCLTAGDGLEAYGVLQRPAVDLALLDLDLTRMEGLELRRAIAEMELALPVLVLVRRGMVEPAVTAMKLGAFECLTKPASAQLGHILGHTP